jgi:hypothetical protein
MEVRGQLHVPVTVAPGKEPDTLQTGGWGNPEPFHKFWKKKNNLLPLPEFKARIVQHLTWSLYRYNIISNKTGNVRIM